VGTQVVIAQHGGDAGAVTALWAALGRSLLALLRKAPPEAAAATA
jgi:hypothetical protein